LFLIKIAYGVRTTQYLASGIDLRLMEGDGFRRTQLCHAAPAVQALSDEWRAALLARDWKQDS